MRGIAVAGLLAALAAAGGARAHTPYLLPNVFDATGRDHVTVEASFTEDFFAPEIAMKAEDFHAIGPGGARVALKPTYLRDVTLLELPLAGDGAWRISSGVRAGRVAKARLVKGEWVFVREGEAPQPGSDAVDMQSITRSDVYVTRGKPTDAALKPTGQGLEFQPVTPPWDIEPGRPVRFVALLDGKPLTGLAVSLHQADSRYVAGKAPPDVVSDAQGRFALTPPAPGLYLAMTRHRLPAQGGGPARSLTYSLTFEAPK